MQDRDAMYCGCLRADAVCNSHINGMAVSALDIDDIDLGAEDVFQIFALGRDNAADWKITFHLRAP